MTVYWLCRNCPQRGEGDRAAENHTRATGHTTATRTRPWPEQPQTAEERQSVRYWLTPAGEQALAASGWTA